MGSLIRSPAHRFVHLRISPRPTNLGEWREILNIASRFGEVEYFKNFRHETNPAPNAAMAIFKTEASAQAMLSHSPIRFWLGQIPRARVAKAARRRTVVLPPETVPTPVAAAEPTPFGIASTMSLNADPGAPFGLGANEPEESSAPSSESSEAFTSISAPVQQQQQLSPSPSLSSDNAFDAADLATESRIYQIQASPGLRNFRNQINESPFHGPFAIDSDMIGQDDLAQRVPLLGMSCVDWRASTKPWRVLRKEREREPYYDPARHGGKTLTQMWDESAKGAGEQELGVETFEQNAGAELEGDAVADAAHGKLASAPDGPYQYKPFTGYSLPP